jgi:hypothetical protein
LRRRPLNKPPNTPENSVSNAKARASDGGDRNKMTCKMRRPVSSCFFEQREIQRDVVGLGVHDSQLLKNKQLVANRQILSYRIRHLVCNRIRPHMRLRPMRRLPPPLASPRRGHHSSRLLTKADIALASAFSRTSFFARSSVARAFRSHSSTGVRSVFVGPLRTISATFPVGLFSAMVTCQSVALTFMFDKCGQLYNRVGNYGLQTVSNSV